MKKLKIFESINILKGGDGDKVDSSTLNQEELEVGCLVEFEHTNNPSIAKEIATDHISRIGDYYHRLTAAGLVDEGDAINLAKSFGWNS